jgi:cytoskeletal protein RodZ
MKLFHHAPDIQPLGAILREARESRSLSMEQAAQNARLTQAEVQGLESDRPIDPRRSRIQAVSYARMLGLDPSAFRESLPPLPTLNHGPQHFISNVSRQPRRRNYSPLEVLAPMGKFVLTLIVITIVLGAWGLVHQISRVRPIPGLTSNTSFSDLFIR